jgi:hypothetical protein
MGWKLKRAGDDGEPHDVLPHFAIMPMGMEPVDAPLWLEWRAVVAHRLRALAAGVGEMDDVREERTDTDR